MAKRKAPPKKAPDLPPRPGPLPSTPYDRFIDRQIDELSSILFPHQESEEEQEAFTDVGRQRVREYLLAFDRASFDAGFDAAWKALVGMRTDTRAYANDRDFAFRKVRHGV